MPVGVAYRLEHADVKLWCHLLAPDGTVHSILNLMVELYIPPTAFDRPSAGEATALFNVPTLPGTDPSIHEIQILTHART